MITCETNKFTHGVPIPTLMQPADLQFIRRHRHAFLPSLCSGADCKLDRFRRQNRAHYANPKVQLKCHLNATNAMHVYVHSTTSPRSTTMQWQKTSKRFRAALNYLICLWVHHYGIPIGPHLWGCSPCKDKRSCDRHKTPKKC